MKRRITVADVQAGLDGFVRGGLVRIAATETPVDAESISGGYRHGRPNHPARRFRKCPVKLPSGETLTLSPGGQNPLIRQIIDQRRSVWSPKDRKFFMDTIFRGYATPAIYLHKEMDEKGPGARAGAHGSQPRCGWGGFLADDPG